MERELDTETEKKKMKIYMKIWYNLYKTFISKYLDGVKIMVSTKRRDSDFILPVMGDNQTTIRQELLVIFLV